MLNKDEKFDSLMILNVHEDVPQMLAWRTNRTTEIVFSIPYVEYKYRYYDFLLKQYKCKRIINLTAMPFGKIPKKIEAIDKVMFENEHNDYIIAGFRDTNIVIRIFSSDNLKKLKRRYEKISEAARKEIAKDYKDMHCFDMNCYLNIGCPSVHINVKQPKDFRTYIPFENYPGTTLHKLVDLETILMSDSYSGRIILLEGPPGTGKTFYIRRLVSFLLREKDFRAVSYFLGTGVSSLDMTQCIGKNILLFEDADFVLDGGNDRGKDLLKVLNLTSGFVDVQALFIFSSNLPISEIDKAFTRDGRLLAHINFELFNEDQANRWLKKHNKKIKKVSGNKSLAELYSIVRKTRKIDSFVPSVELGFIAAKLKEIEAEAKSEGYGVE